MLSIRRSDDRDGVGVGTILDDDSPPVAGRRSPRPETSRATRRAHLQRWPGEWLDCRQLATSDLLVGAGYAAVLAPRRHPVRGRHRLGSSSRSYDPSWGRVKSITSARSRAITSTGRGSAAGYFRYFGAGSWRSGEGVLQLRPRRLAHRRAQLELRVRRRLRCGLAARSSGCARDLAAHPASCTLAYWHHPRFSSGSHGEAMRRTRPFWQALYDANADARPRRPRPRLRALRAADSERRARPRRGIRQFVVGSGGKECAPSRRAPNSEARDVTSLGVLELTLGAGAYEWRFRAGGRARSRTAARRAATEPQRRARARP